MGANPLFLWDEPETILNAMSQGHGSIVLQGHRAYGNWQSVWKGSVLGGYLNDILARRLRHKEKGHDNRSNSRGRPVRPLHIASPAPGHSEGRPRPSLPQLFLRAFL